MKVFIVFLFTLAIYGEYVVIDRFRPTNDSVLQLNCTLMSWSEVHNDTNTCWKFGRAPKGSSLEREMMYAESSNVIAVFIKSRTVTVGRTQYTWSGQNETHLVYLIETNLTLDINTTINMIDLAENEWTVVFDSWKFKLFMVCIILSYSTAVVHCVARIAKAIMCEYDSVLFYASSVVVLVGTMFRFMYVCISPLGKNHLLGQCGIAVLGTTSLPWVIFTWILVSLKYISTLNQNSNDYINIVISAIFMLILAIPNLVQVGLVCTYSTNPIFGSLVPLVTIVCSIVMSIVLGLLSYKIYLRIISITTISKKITSERFVVVNFINVLCGLFLAASYLSFMSPNVRGKPTSMMVSSALIAVGFSVVSIAEMEIFNIKKIKLKTPSTKNKDSL